MPPGPGERGYRLAGLLFRYGISLTTASALTWEKGKNKIKFYTYSMPWIKNFDQGDGLHVHFNMGGASIQGSLCMSTNLAQCLLQGTKCEKVLSAMMFNKSYFQPSLVSYL